MITAATICLGMSEHETNLLHVGIGFVRKYENWTHFQFSIDNSN